ncbi:hypothetical protein [Staphylococcus sp. NAM3COL9]|uniref:hypothetical protein n=1 Tax=Staphylococcus sp. NAM3COL9 TaxID=1667172 RepID=UPI000710303D|nr:hypothetical protein [Staphylococcus sp. NAM3COL9]
MIQGKLVDNNYSNLTIVFQSAGRISNALFDKILNNEASMEDIKKAHEKYTWFNFSKDTYSDYYFIEDFYSKSYGWYMFNEGNNIIKEVNESLTELIGSKNYVTVTAYGSSKGGTAVYCLV